MNAATMPSSSSSAQGSVVGGAAVMLLLSLLLCWLPGIGTLIAGVVGGKIAGGIGNALLAALLPSLILGAALFVLATLFTGMPLIGFIAAMGGLVLAMTQVGTLLLGAAIGGLLA
jgi:hypothetical protein